jgi:hypothetical protein
VDKKNRLCQPISASGSINPSPDSDLTAMPASASATKDDIVRKAKQLVDLHHETSLVITILKFARSGHATNVMVEQAIALVERHITVARDQADDGMLRSAVDLKAGLEEALKNGVESLRSKLGPTNEALKVEEPLARARRALGHEIRRQHRCAGGIIDIFDLTADELIECKFQGSSTALGEAAGQLKRYSKSFPGTSLSIAVRSIEPEASWLADVLRRQGIVIIEIEPG